MAIINIFFQKTLLNIATLCIFILCLIISPIVLILILPIYLFRFILSTYIVPKLKPNFQKILTTRSSIYSADDIYTKPNNTLIVTGIFEDNIDIEEFRQMAFSKVINARHAGNREELIWPELQQKISNYCGFLFFEWDQNFNINNHIKPFDSENVEISEEKLLEIQKHFLRKPFEKDKALWEVSVINFSQTMLHGKMAKSAIIIRIHHCLGDGISIMQTYLKVSGKNDDQVAKPEKLERSQMQKFLYKISYPICGPFLTIRQFIESIDINAWHYSRNIKILKEYSGGISEGIPLEAIKGIRSKFKNKKIFISSIVLSGLSGGIRKYFVNNQLQLPKNIYSIIPLRILSHPVDKLRNHFSGCFVCLPILEADPMKRLLKINSHLMKLKNSAIPNFIFASMPFIGGLFQWMIKLIFRNFMATILLTTLPGPQENISFGENCCQFLSVGCGLLAGNTAIVFTALSYNGQIRLGSWCEKGVISSDSKVKELLQYIKEEFDTLKQYEVPEDF